MYRLGGFFFIVILMALSCITNTKQMEEHRFDNIFRIEIEPPEQIDQGEIVPLVINGEEAVKTIVGAMAFRKSAKEAIMACKMPPGFTLRMVGPDEVYEADITISGHKHFLLKSLPDGSIHYELPPELEGILMPYFLKILE